MKKKVLYIHQYFNTPEDNGSIRSYMIAKAFISYGYDVEMLTTTRLRKDLPKYIEGIKLTWIKSDYNNHMSYINRVFKFLHFSILSSYYVLVKKYDFIYATSTPITIGIPALLAKTLKRKKFIFEVRDVWPEVPIEMGIIKSMIIKKISICLASQLYRKATILVPLSSGMKKKILDNYNFDYNKTVVVENGSSEKFFELSKNDIKNCKKTFNLSNQKKNIIYPGTFGAVNNLEYVLRLAARLINTDICFYLVGTGSEEKKLKKLAIRNKTLNNNVFFLEPVSKTLIFKLIKSCDALISTVKPIPALYDNSANKFFDGLRAGKMIIINHPGWQSDFINEAQCGLSLSTDLDLASKEIKKAFYKNDYVKMGLNAKLNSEVFEYNELFSKLMNRINKEIL